MERSVRELCGLGSSLQTRPVLYYSNDAQLLMVSRHREELGRYFRFLMPAPDLIEGMVDKAHFHDLAARHRFPTPRSLLCRAHDTSAIVLKADTQEELTRAVSLMRARGLDFMLQEFVGGDDQICSFHAYFDRYSEPLAWRSWSSRETSPMAFTACTRYLDATGQPLPAERPLEEPHAGISGHVAMAHPLAADRPL